MEVNVIKCPNCGASSSNHTNCEYCGSLLVRFVDKGIDLSTTSYLTNDFVYEGVIDALKQNLERQELNPGKLVTTDICYKSSSTVKLSRKRHGVAVVGRTGSAHWNDGDNIKLGEGESVLPWHHLRRFREGQEFEGWISCRLVLGHKPEIGEYLQTTQVSQPVSGLWNP